MINTFKKEVFFIIILLFSLLISFGLVSSDFCCQTSSGSGEFVCYSTGVCCKIDTYDENGVLLEYWHSIGCFDFLVWIEPSSMMFTVGKKTPINLYVNNLEQYTDRYNISYSVESSNPALISVDLTGVTPTENVDWGQIKNLHPRIMILSTAASGTVWFNVTSWGDISVQKNASLTIRPSDLPVSLPEYDFNGFWWIMIIILVGLIYYSSKLKNISS